MAWANSKIFRQMLADTFTGTMPTTLATDTPKVALYPTGVTPNQDVAANASAPGTGVWTGEITDTNWPAGGRPLVSGAINAATAATVFYDANDTTGAGNVTLSGVFGCLVYDDTVTTPVADQGLCYNYFGGSQGVTAGTFTVVWHANGIFRFTL